ncbi:hypothetical protein ACIBEJ_00450 [Nonomuraea sp. NPDC050790]|uniref:hypothetical protein n=1 Tax=Nonomuraea sp. NPDC050790 TaxID=3364371 RepID=UPI0037A32C2E
MSPPLGDPDVDVLPPVLDARGLSYTLIEDGTTLVLKPAGPGWQCRLSPQGRLSVTHRGAVLVDVDQFIAMPGWRETALTEQKVLVIAGPPIPAVAGKGTLRDLLDWIGGRITCSGIVSSVEGP